MSEEQNGGVVDPLAIFERKYAEDPMPTTPAVPEPDRPGLPRKLTTNEAQQEKFNEGVLEILFNATTSRSQFIDRLMDSRRDINKECGWPDKLQLISGANYRDMYDRLTIAKRLVEIFPNECWKVQPVIVEDDDPSVETPFEKKVKALHRQLRQGSYYRDDEGSPIWNTLKRADIASRIGRFGVLVFGFNDGKELREPVDWIGLPEDQRPIQDKAVDAEPRKNGDPMPGLPANTPPLPAPGSFGMGTDRTHQGISLAPPVQTGEDPYAPREEQGDQGIPEIAPGEMKLLYLMPFDESLIQILQYESNPHNPRYRLPVMYRITLNDPRYPVSGVGLTIATVTVHWSRVLHLAVDRLSSDTFATPIQQPCWNNLLDLRKLYGGSAEMFWKGAFMGISFETHPQLGGEVKINQTALRQQLDNYQNTTQRWLALMGMTAKTLAPQVSDPTPFIEIQLEAIAIMVGIPIRILKGSERGELASSQDQGQWDGKVMEHQKSYLTPYVIVPFFDRLIHVGVLPVPTAKPKKLSDSPPEEDEEVDDGEDVEVDDPTTPDPAKKPPVTNDLSTAIWGTEGPDQQMPESSDHDEEGGYSVIWPEIDSMTKSERADMLVKRTQAMGLYLSGDVGSFMAPEDYLTREMGYTDEEAEQIQQNASAHMQQAYADSEDTALVPGAIPSDPNDKPDFPPGIADDSGGSADDSSDSSSGSGKPFGGE